MENNVASQHSTNPELDQLTKKQPVGRPVDEPKAEHGKLIHQQLEKIGMKRQALAKKLGVSPATVTRYLNEDTRYNHLIKHGQVCEAVGFDTVQTNQYLQLFTESQNVNVPHLVRGFNVDIDAYDKTIDSITRIAHSALEGWSSSLGRGADLNYVIGEIQDIKSSLKQLPYPVQERRIADVRIRTDMFLASLQEVAFPWQAKRPQVAGRTYDELVREVFYVVGKESFAQEYATLRLRRAVLGRENREGPDAETILEEFREMGGFMKRIENVKLVVAYRCQHLHTLAVQATGSEKEIERWKGQLEKIKEHVAGLRVTEQELEELEAIVQYAEGVGYKRFTWQLREERRETRRQAYAEESARLLNGLRGSEAGIRAVQNINVYHASMPVAYAEPELAISALDAQVWYDPEAALQQAYEVKRSIAGRYPSQEAKLHAQIRLLHNRLGHNR